MPLPAAPRRPGPAQRTRAAIGLFPALAQALAQALALGLSAALMVTSAQAQAGGRWSGDLTLTIKGQGGFDDPPLQARWAVNRTARATVVLDRSFRGAGIARSEDSRNTERYETWTATRPQPAQLDVDDQGEFDGPLFHPKNLRRDTTRWTCPSKDKPRPGQLRASLLQFDHQRGTVTWEVPRIFTACDKYVRMDFHKGLPDFVARGTQMSEDGVELEFEIVHRLRWPAEWPQLTVPFKPGQTEIVLSRKLAFAWPLRAEGRKAPLDGELTLVLRKEP